RSGDLTERQTVKDMEASSETRPDRTDHAVPEPHPPHPGPAIPGSCAPPARGYPVPQTQPEFPHSIARLAAVDGGYSVGCSVGGVAGHRARVAGEASSWAIAWAVSSSGSP